MHSPSPVSRALRSPAPSPGTTRGSIPFRSDDEAASTREVAPRHSPGYVPELESLRGVAILLVVTYHASQLLGAKPDSRSLPLAFVFGGHTGVSLFFILSAFLLSGPFLAEYGTGAKVLRGQYFARRALRILPLYYLALLAGTVFTVMRAADPPATLLATAPFLWFSYWSATPMWGISDPWWSLATEVQFYLVLPLLPFCLRTRAGLVVVAGFLLTYVAFIINLIPFASPKEWMYVRWILAHTLLGRAPLFALGIGAAWLMNTHGQVIRAALRKRWWIRNGGADLALAVTLVALAVQLQWVIQVSYSNAEIGWPQWHLPEGVLWTAIMLLVLLAPLRTKSVIANPILGFVGLVSYSLYLVHYPVLVFGAREIARHHRALVVPWSWSTAAVAAGLLLVALGISAVTYQLIERPFLIRKAQLARRLLTGNAAKSRGWVPRGSHFRCD